MNTTVNAELNTLQFAHSIAKREMKLVFGAYEALPSARNYTALMVAVADYQAACYELIEYRRATQEAATRSDMWLRAEARAMVGAA